MRRGSGWTTAAMALWLGAGVAAHAQQPAQPGYEVTGVARITDDAARAREQALRDAMKRAVEQAVLQAAPEARGRLYMVSARARDYVTTYRMLEEGEVGGQFQLRILAEVDLTRLLRDLQVVQPAAPAGASGAAARPRLSICPAGPGPGPSPGADELRTAIAGALAGRVEIAAAGPCPPPPSEVALIYSVSVDGARSGEIRGTQPRLYGTMARAQLRLLGRGGAVREEAAEAAGFGESPEAAERAAERAAALMGVSRLGEQLPALVPAEGGGEGVTVTFEGVSGQGDFERLRKHVLALPGVSAVEPRRVWGGAAGEGGRLALLLRTTSAGAAIGTALQRAPVPGLRFQVVPEGPTRLRVLLAPESALPREGQ